jgi:hypothetical protein
MIQPLPQKRLMEEEDDGMAGDDGAVEELDHNPAIPPKRRPRKGASLKKLKRPAKKKG